MDWKRLLAWAQRNERHLGAVLFILGFIGDLFTFAFLSVSLVNLAFLGYLALAMACTFGSHVLSRPDEGAPFWKRALSVVFPLGAQYAIGSLLSGCLIYYTKSAAVFVSWPFLLILAAVFIGNEYFRTYYKHLAFQTVLLFFAIYAYAIFALPLALHKLGFPVFLASTVVSLAAFALFLGALAFVKRPGFLRSLRYVLPATAAVVVLMVSSYLTGIIPPIPLTLPSAGVYYDVRKQSGDYVVSLENAPRPWWDLSPQIMHHAPGQPLYAFSSVSAPYQFAATIVHVWEIYDPVTGKWIERSRVSFSIAGGRDGGYRGYSEVADPEMGLWRVSIETPSGQVIGRLHFTVVDVPTPPLIKEEVR